MTTSKSSWNTIQSPAGADWRNFCGQYVKKGKPLYVKGYLKTHSWETPEGIRKDRTEIVMENIVLLGDRDPAMPEGRAKKIN